VDETEAMRRAFADGIAWGEAKQALFERIDAEISPLREKYETLIAQPHKIEAILIDGARRVRERYAHSTMQRLRAAVGLRDLGSTGGAAGNFRSPADEVKPVSNVPAFKQYRESDGLFYFKLAYADDVLLQSRGFAAPKEIGQLLGRVRADDSTAVLDALLAACEPIDADTRVKVVNALSAIRLAEETERQAKAAAKERAGS